MTQGTPTCAREAATSSACATTNVVVVGQDNNQLGAGELLGVLVTPLASSTGVAGGDQAEVLEGFDVLLTLDDMDARAGSSGLKDPR